MRDSRAKYIVARYEEDLEWLQPIAEHCIVINKGTTPISECMNDSICIHRTNVGRESDTYLHFIVNNYDNLPEVCVFTQGCINDHVRSNQIEYLNQLASEALELGMSRPRASCSNPYDKDWGPLWNRRKDGYFLNENYKDGRHILFYWWFISNICSEYPKLMKIHMNGIFAVRRDRILKHPRSFYLKLRSQVDWHPNPIEGHFLERSWFYIFDFCRFAYNPLSVISPLVLKKLMEEVNQT